MMADLLKMDLDRKSWILFFLFLIPLGVIDVFAQKNVPFKYKVGIIGNPGNPDISYDDAQLKRMKGLGFNTLQLNIAWGSRPADEPLNLEDILTFEENMGNGKVKERFNKIKQRAIAAKKWGFRTIFHFGAPRVEALYKSVNIPEKIDATTDKNSVQRKEILLKYQRLLVQLHREIPEIDDILVYTFDQEAWIGNEFGDGPIDRNIPLHKRLPQFLNALASTWLQERPNGMFWWEPWELSAGQIYACLPEINGKNIGFALHSNIAEVQLSRPVDVWLRNMANLLEERKIPVIGEIFMASANEEVEPLQHLSAPRLVFEQMEAMYGLKTLHGVKEYYGVLPGSYDPSMLMSSMKMINPQLSLADGLKKLSAEYGAAAAQVSAAWEATAKSLQLFPWDASWNLRRLPKRGLVFHKWDKLLIAGKVAASPSWKSTRRSLFMVTENEELDPWFYEDLELRCQISADEAMKAIAAYQLVLPMVAGNQQLTAYLMATIKDHQVFEQSVRAIQCYCKEANLAFLMRKYTAKNEPIPETLLQQFNQIMLLDVKNQERSDHVPQGRVTAKKMLALFNENPKAWLEKYLLP